MSEAMRLDRSEEATLRRQQLEALWGSFVESGGLDLQDERVCSGGAAALRWLAAGGLDQLKLRSLAMGADLGDIDPQLLLLDYLSDELRELSVEKG